jgi:hypothetical protein
LRETIPRPQGSCIYFLWVTEEETGHGRTEKREVRTVTDIDWLPEKENMEGFANDYSNRVSIAPLDFHVIEKCWAIFNRYGFSYWDSLLVASACSILYTEDLQHGQVIKYSLKIINPFK